MSSKHWVVQAAAVLQESLHPVPHELNELDWKSSLSTHKDRLAEHLMALVGRQSNCVLRHSSAFAVPQLARSA